MDNKITKLFWKHSLFIVSTVVGLAGGGAFYLLFNAVSDNSSNTQSKEPAVVVDSPAPPTQ